MRYVILAFWVIIILIALTFTALNSHSVIINYYLGTHTFSLPVLLLLVLCLGIILGVLMMMPSIWRAKNSARKYKQKIKHHAQELDNLRRMPIQEDH